jgi:hypothetical protein
MTAAREESLMWTRIRRSAAAMATIVAGLGAGVYGYRSHAIAVVDQYEEAVKIVVPGPMAGKFAPRTRGSFLPKPGAKSRPGPLGRSFPPAGDSEEQGSASRDGGPVVPPGFMTKTVLRTVRNTLMLGEPVLARDVTVGGVIRVASGELRRTYHGDVPKLCPS